MVAQELKITGNLKEKKTFDPPSLAGKYFCLFEQIDSGRICLQKRILIANNDGPWCLLFPQRSSFA